jgi:hypothetical protein
VRHCGPDRSLAPKTLMDLGAGTGESGFDDDVPAELIKFAPNPNPGALGEDHWNRVGMARPR